MARSGVSYFDVEKAASTLLAAGTNPTVDSVRAELGHTGSRTTINKYLKDWRENRHDLKDSQTLLNEYLTEIIGNLALKLREQASEPLEKERQKWRDKEQSLLQQAEVYCTKIADISRQYEQECQAHQLLRDHNQELEKSLNTLQKQLSKNDQALAAATAALAEKDRHILTADEKYQHSQANLEHFRTATAAARDQLISDHQQQIAQLSGQNHQQQQLITHQQEKAVELKSELLQRRQQAEADKQALQDSAAALENSQQQAKQLTAELTQSSLAISQSQQALYQQKQKLADITARHTEIDKRRQQEIESLKKEAQHQAQNNHATTMNYEKEKAKRELLSELLAATKNVSENINNTSDQ